MDGQRGQSFLLEHAFFFFTGPSPSDRPLPLFFIESGSYFREGERAARLFPLTNGRRNRFFFVIFSFPAQGRIATSLTSLRPPCLLSAPLFFLFYVREFR